jgi:hypothetical protein
MKILRVFIVSVSLLISDAAFPQSDSIPYIIKNKMSDLYGFCRAGFYGWTDGTGREPKVSSGYMDVGLIFQSGYGTHFSFSSELRYRYGYEFMKPVSRFDVREARALITGKKWNASIGQQIIKWGRTDILNPEELLSPCNYKVRSSEKEDINLGNLSARLRYYPAQAISLEAVAIPYYRPSILLADLIHLPAFVNMENFSGLRTDRIRFTYALRADMHFDFIKMGLSWFDGYNPIPGTMLKNMEIDSSGAVAHAKAQLSHCPYRMRNAGIDLELTMGKTVIRGEAAWSDPYKSFKVYEYVPMSEIKWVTDIERSFGSWQVVAEYSGKMMPGYMKSSVVPLTDQEQNQDAFDISALPNGTDIYGFIKEQVGVFNRLYNYQLHKWYHLAGLRIEKEILYGKISFSILTRYNFTSHDLYVNPGISFSPLERLTINTGLDYYSGKKGSLFDLTGGSLNTVYAALRIDF